VAPSKAGSFHYPVQAQAPRSRGNSFQYTSNGETYSSTTSRHGSLRVPCGVTQYNQSLEAPPTFAALEKQPLPAARVTSALPGPTSAWSNLPHNAGTEKKAELLAVLHCVKEQCKAMADRITENAGDVQGGGFPLAKGASPEEELPEKWMGA